MKKAAVIGVGKMGQVICHAMSKLGFDVVGIDASEHGADNFRKYVNGPNGSFYLVDDDNPFHRGIEFEKPDVVISSLPYHQTEKVAFWCIDNGFRYCDLGGRVDVSENINNHAEENATKPVFTDLGLAPGWVNILAEEGYRKLYGTGDIIKVEMMVGGLPDYSISNKNPLRYGVTWSVDGLINEYRDDCIVLENGEIKTVQGMEGLEIVETDSLDKLEAFYTSGGASHSIHSMKERGVKDCCYKTLRYRGHRDIVRFLIRDCDLDDETLAKIFEGGCGYAESDQVIILAKVHKDNKTWKEEKLVNSDLNFSAMQKATAFPISSVAALMTEGIFDGDKDQHRDYHTQFSKSLGYADIPFEQFNDNLTRLFT